MHQLPILNTTPAAANTGAGVRASAQPGSPGMVQAIENNGDSASSQQFGPMLSELAAKMEQAGVDTSNPEAIQSYLAQQGVEGLQGLLQIMGMQSDTVTQLEGQTLADAMAATGFELPPGRQADLIRDWDNAPSPAAKLNILAGLAGSLGETVTSVAGSASPVAQVNALNALPEGQGQYQNTGLSAWSLTPAASGAPTVQVLDADGSNGEANPWLTNAGLRVQSGVRTTGANDAGVNALMPGDGVDGENTESAWRQLTGLQGTTLTNTQAQQAVAGQNGQVAADSAMRLTSEADQLFRGQFDAATADLGAEGFDDVMQDKPALNTRLTDWQTKQAAAASRPYTTGVNVPVTDPQWGDQLGQKIVWMTGRQIQAAEIHLNPAELGPVEVKIQVNNDQATVTFNAQHATVREMLESNVQRLREMMEANGVDLSEVNVDTGDQGEQYAAQDQGDNDGGRNGKGGDGEAEDGLATADGDVRVQQTVSERLIDDYA